MVQSERKNKTYLISCHQACLSACPRTLIMVFKKVENVHIETLLPVVNTHVSFLLLSSFIRHGQNVASILEKPKLDTSESTHPVQLLPFWCSNLPYYL